MLVCVLQNLEKERVLWTDFLASCREINRFSVSKIGPEPAKPTISLALLVTYVARHMLPCKPTLKLLHSERPKLYIVLAVLSATGLISVYAKVHV